MSDVTSVPAITLFQWSTPTSSNPRLAQPISATDTTLVFTSAPVDDDGVAITGNFSMGCTVQQGTNAGYTELIRIPAGAISGVTATGVVRGTSLEGLDYTTGSAALAVAHNQDDPVFCAISPSHIQILFQALTAAIGANIKFNGRPLFLTTAATNSPQAAPVFADATSRDAAITSPLHGDICYVTGLGALQVYSAGIWNSLAVGTVYAAGAGLDLTAGTFRVKTSDTSTFVTVSSGAGDNGKVPVLGASGTLATGFIGSYIPESVVTAKGDIVAATATSTASNLAVGSDHQVVTADSLTATGLRYSYPEQFVIDSSWPIQAVNTPTTSFAGLSGYIATDVHTNDYTAIGANISALDGTALGGGVNCLLNFNQLSAGNIIDVTFRCAIDSTTNSAFAVGFGGSSDLISGTTQDHGIFRWNGTNFVSSTADGTTEETQAIAGITLTNINTYRVIYTVGTSVKFYVNGVLKNTHSTHIPATSVNASVTPAIQIQTLTTASKLMRFSTICQLRFPRS